MRRSLPRQVNHLLATSAKQHRSSASSSSPLPRFHPSSSAASSSSSARIGGARAFSSSRPARENEAPRSPFSVFVETLKSEVEKDKALQGNVKQLGGEVGQMQDSESMKKAKEMYERARITNILKNNPSLQKAADDMKASGVKVSDAVAEALRQVEESEFLRALNRARESVSSAAATATAPVRNTAAYRALAESVSEVFDDSNAMRYGGYAQKEVRRKKRQQRLEKLGRSGMGVGSRVKANEEAGAALVLSKTSSAGPTSGWETYKSTSPVFQKLSDIRERYDESEDPFISTVRSVTSWFGRLADENETAKVTRLMRQMDPGFEVELFARELREYIIPEVLDAYLTGDQESLKGWCGEAAYSILWATMSQFKKQQLISESRVITIANLDVQKGSMLDEETPVFVATFQTQEIFCFRNAVTKEIGAGSPNEVVGVNYAVVIGRVEDELDDEITGGWKVLEIVRRGAGM